MPARETFAVVAMELTLQLTVVAKRMTAMAGMSKHMTGLFRQGFYGRAWSDVPACAACRAIVPTVRRVIAGTTLTKWRV